MSAPPQLYVELADDVFLYEDDWLEYIDNKSPVSSAFDAMSQNTTLTGWIPCNKKRSALKFFLGYSYALDEAPFSLCRELPARHPVFPNLYAYAASFTDVAPEAGDDDEHDVTPGTWQESPFEGSKDETMRFANYEKTLMTVQYRSFGRMRFLPDSDIGDYKDEYKRYVLFGTDPSVEALSADGSSQLTFAEGDPDGQAFPAPIAELMGKVALTLRWFQVPHNYLSTDPDINLLDKIIGRMQLDDDPDDTSSWDYPPILGTVNQDFFLGFYPGTLLLRAVKVEEMMYPVTTADPFDVAGGYNLTLVWEHFDPVKGVQYGPTVETGPPAKSPYRGHRIFPWRNNGKWYYATREDGDEMLPLTDHYNVFQSVLDV